MKKLVTWRSLLYYKNKMDIVEGKTRYLKLRKQ